MASSPRRSLAQAALHLAGLDLQLAEMGLIAQGGRGDLLGPRPVLAKLSGEILE